MSQISRICLVLAISTLGIKTSFEALLKLAWRPMALLLIETQRLAAILVINLFVLTP